MASYNSSEQAYLSSYIPPYDVKAYVGVGMQKQAQYDQGVARVQGALDTVAGLDIIRPIDKEYLQTKMSELNTQLQGVAGGDFSNQSVVNQAMGMAGKLYKDPTIQSAVVSTANIKSFLADQKNLKEKHPELYSQSNEYTDTLPMNDYLNSNELSKSYNGPKSATIFKDYHTPINELISKVSPETTVELTPDGQYQFKSQTGVIVNPERLRSIIQGYIASNPEAAGQLQRDAVYTYKDYDKLSLEGYAKNNAANTIGKLDQMNKEYAANIAGLSTSEVDKIDDLKRKIADNQLAQKHILDNTENYTNLIRNGNLNSAKIALFSDNLMGTYVNAYQQDNIKRELVENHKNIQEANFGYKAMEVQANLLEHGMEMGPNGMPQAVDPNGPNYAAYISSQRAKGKSVDGTNIVSVGVPHVDTVDTEGKTTYGRNEVDAEIQTLTRPDGQGTLDIANSNLKNYYYNRLKSTNPDYTDQQKADAFNTWKAGQYDLFSKSQPTEAIYKQWRAQTYPNDIKLQGLNELKTQADDLAAKNNPLGNIGVLQMKGTNGAIVVDPQKNPESLTTIHTFYDGLIAKIGGILSPTNENDLGTVLGKFDTPVGKQIANEELAKYKGNKDYAALDAIVNGKNGFGQRSLREAYKTFVVPVGELMDKRKLDADKYIQDNAKGLAPQDFPITGKPEERGDVKTRIESELAARTDGLTINGNKLTAKEFAAENIEPISIVKDPVSGHEIYKFRVKGYDKVQKVESTSQASLLPPEDPNQYLINYLTTHESTPLTGEGALATYNGKVRFQVRRNFITPGTYDVSLINNGSPIDLELHVNDDPNSPLQQYHTPTQIINAMQKLENAVNPYTKTASNPNGRPYTRDEIIYRFTPGHTEADLKTYTQANNQ